MRPDDMILDIGRATADHCAELLQRDTARRRLPCGEGSATS
jgi:hypothetical protein